MEKEAINKRRNQENYKAAVEQQQALLAGGHASCSNTVQLAPPTPSAPPAPPAREMKINET